MKAEHESIGKRRAELDSERRKFLRDAMTDFDRQHHEKLRVLRSECEAVGHVWRYTHNGPFGDPWFGCYVCHATKVELEART